MVKERFCLGVLVIVLVFGMAVVGCDVNNSDPSSSSPSKSYTEGDVYVSVLGVMMHYYFSNTPEGLEQAAFDNGISLNPPIKNASWVLNPNLDINVNLGRKL